MLSTERHFTADATHQLRSGITGISMRFEILARHPNPDVVDEALAGLSQTEQLNATIDELLAADARQLDPGADDVRPRHRRRRPRRRVEPAVRRGAALDRGHLDGDRRRCRRHEGPRRSGDRHPDRQRPPPRPGLGHAARRGPSVTVIDQGPGLSDEAGRDRCSTDPSIRRRDTAAACRSPGAWRRSTEAASTSPRHRPLRVRYRLVRG